MSAIAAFVVLSAMVSGTGTAADAQQRVEADLAYRCAFPSGQQSVTVSVAAKLPASAKVGETIEAADVTTTFELPEGEVAAWAKSGAASARADTRFTVEYAQDAKSARAQWRGTADDTPLPASGAMEVVATGDVPTVTAGSTGDLTLSAGEFGFDLVMKTTDGEGTTTESVSVSCNPDPEAAQRQFAVIPIGADSADSDDALATPQAPEGASRQPDGRTRARAPKVREATPEGSAGPEAPPCHYEDPPSNGLVAYITGYSNVRKLDGASLLPLSCVIVDQDVSPEIAFKDGVVHALTSSTGTLEYEGRAQTPPGPATFMSFGIMPTTAKMVLEQTGPMTMDTDIAITFPRAQGTTLVRVPLTLRLYDVKVNGVPLPVGDSCRTKGPLYSEEPDPEEFPGPHVVMLGYGTSTPAGGDVEGYMLTFGGPLTGSITIPPFTGCGVHEDLDDLLTASISGPGNFVKQMQGPTCGVGVVHPDFLLCTDDLQPKKIPTPAR